MRSVPALQPEDRESLERQLRQHCLDLRRHVRRIARGDWVDEDWVDEIVQETLVFACANLRGFRPGTSFLAWLKAIAWNVLRAHRLRWQRERVHEVKYYERRLAAMRGSEHVFERTFLTKSLERLPKGARRLLEMKYVLRYSAQQIAENLGLTPLGVRCRLFRIRCRLRAQPLSYREN